MTNTVIDGITSLNSKNFNFGVVECKNFKAINFKVTNPGDSPNTDGMHVERCSDVTIEGAQIGTGDDCISLGQGLTNVQISKVTCGPGHGIRCVFLMDLFYGIAYNYKLNEILYFTPDN